MLKPVYDRNTGLKEAQHIQVHYEEEMQKFFRDSNVRRLMQIDESGYNRGWAECEKYMRSHFNVTEK